MSETGGPEHDFEPVAGLPANLPEGEHILWQGAPKSDHVARRVLKSRWIAGYFLVLLAWAVVAGIYDGRTPGSILFSASAIAIMATIVLCLIEAFAWGVEKTTLYTITNRRTVMRIGVALSATFNLPHVQVVSADMAADKNGDGDITLTLKPGHKLSYLVFWPHAKGWRAGSMVPRMVGLADVRIPARILAQALTMQADEQIAGSVRRTAKAGTVSGLHPVAAE